MCTHTRQVEHQRCSRTGRFQKNHKILRKKTHYLVNTLNLNNIYKITLSVSNISRLGDCLSLLGTLWQFYKEYIIGNVTPYYSSHPSAGKCHFNAPVGELVSLCITCFINAMSRRGAAAKMYVLYYQIHKITLTFIIGSVISL